MIVIDADATRQALPFDRLVVALRTQFAAGCEVPARHVHQIAAPDGRGDALTSLIMPAWSVGRYYGVKVINIASGNAARGLPGLHASYLLHDASTGVPLTLIDGDELTVRRTVAASALAASFLARDDARHLLVVGAGRIARLLPEAHRAVRPIKQVSVWARRHGEAEKLAAEWRGEGWHAQAVRDLASAADDADVVSCATLAAEPVMQGRWLQPGSHLNLIGSFTPAMREADDDCFAGARWYVDTDEAMRKSGDLLGPLSRGVITPASLQGTLASLCRGEAHGRRSDDERTVFKSVGTALEDLAAAVLAYETVTGAGR
jgi:ornithine cyclodeaminase/alanine dehydrogenase-like protein (mu-crystallin family)